LSEAADAGHAAAPSTGDERLPAIDIARGIAMLGVALVNVHAFAAVWASVYGLDLAKNAADVVAEYAVAMLFTHRSYPVLAFLFGVGLAWQWQRLPADRQKPNALRARLWVLLAIGVAHGLLLWPGDVLSAYGIIGLVIVSLLRFSDRAILYLTLGAYLGVLIVYNLVGVSFIFMPQAPAPFIEPPASFSMSSGWQALLARRGEYLERGLAQALVPDFWAHVLLGIWAGRSGALRRFLAAPMASRGLVVAGALSLIVGSTLELLASRHGGWDVRVIQDPGWGLMSIAIIWASLGAIWGWLTLAALWARAGGGALCALAIASGRAPLTQFIGQSVIFAVLFNESLLGLHGHPGRAVQSLIAIATWLVMCFYIRGWFALGRPYGPMETIWRALTKWLSPQPAQSSVVRRDDDHESRTP